MADQPITVEVFDASGKQVATQQLLKDIGGGYVAPQAVVAGGTPAADLTASGTLSAAQATQAAATSAVAGSCVALTLGSGQSDAIYSLTGTWTTSTVVFDASLDPAPGTTNWVTLSAYQVGDTSGAAQSALSGVGAYYVNCSGYAQVRARMSALAGSDSITVLARASTGPHVFGPHIARVGYKEYAGLSATAGAAVTVANTAADLLGSIDALALGMRSFSLHITAIATGATIVVYGSNTGLPNDWISLPLENIIGSAGTVGTSISVVGVVKGEISTRYIRVRQTAYTSGTTSAVVELSAAPMAWNFTGVSAVQNGAWSLSATTTGGTTPFRLVSAATTNATSLKASAGQLYGLIATNTTASAKFVKFYNKAGAPTVGTDTPVLTIGVPPNGCAPLSSSIGIAFATGIACAITGAAADADTTAVAAGDVILSGEYK